MEGEIDGKNWVGRKGFEYIDQILKDQQTHHILRGGGFAERKPLPQNKDDLTAVFNRSKDLNEIKSMLPSCLNNIKIELILPFLDINMEKLLFVIHIYVICLIHNVIHIIQCV